MKALFVLGLVGMVSYSVSSQAEVWADERGGGPGAQTVADELSAELDFRRWPDDGFVETVMSRLDALSAAHASDRGAVMLDLAEIYLGQMLTVEADSFVLAAGQGGWSGTPRYRALRDAVDVLRGKAISDFGNSPLNRNSRKDVGLWRALNGLAIGDEAALRENLGDALAALSIQSGPVARSLLPLIAEAAISVRDIELSQAALSLLDTVQDYKDGAAIQYLQGRHQENLGNQKSAVEAYFEASKGWDRYAARSRIALADLAIKDNSTGALLAARDVLSAGVGAWRGDSIEIATLQRQARVNGLLGEPVDALLAHRRILTRFPDSQAAKDSKSSAEEHLRTVYKQGATGQISFAYWFELHQILLPTYRFIPSFPAVNELLADSIVELGGLHLAISEYQQILSIFDAWPQTQRMSAPQADVNRVRLKLSKALFHAGLWRETIDTLDQISGATDERFQSEVSKLRADALTELGDAETLLQTTLIDPDAENLRHLGQAFFIKGEWNNAKDRYAQLWKSFPEDFRLSDASYLLIAAFRAGDEDLARKVAAAFPTLTESQDIAGLARSLLDSHGPLFPLQGNDAVDRLESAQQTMRLIENSGL